MRILVVEDEKKLAAYIKKGLEENYFAVDVSHDGEEGLFMLNANDYDLAILDIMLPRKNGFEALREARRYGRNRSVLLLTAKDAIEDKAHGLDLGADGYLVNPFSVPGGLPCLPELTAHRIHQQKICIAGIYYEKSRFGINPHSDCGTRVGLPF